MEKACQRQFEGCDDRNCCRLTSHLYCYASCGFFPNPFDLPAGADVVGWQDLIPGCFAQSHKIPLGY